MESNIAQLPLTHRLWGWFEKNRKPVVSGTAVAVAAGLLVWFFIYQRNEKEVAAGEAFSAVALGQSDNPLLHPESAEAYLKVAAAYPNSPAGERALLLAAGDLFVQGKYPEAKVQFDKFNREHPESPFAGEAQLGSAACLEADGKTTDAVAAYKTLADRHSGDALAVQAKFALARLYEAQKQSEQAYNLFKDVAQADPYGSMGNEAAVRVREMELKNPSLAPKPLPPAKPAAPAVAPAAKSAPPAAKMVLPTNPPLSIPSKK